LAAAVEVGKAQFLPEVEVVTGNGIQYPDSLSESSDWREFGGVVNYEIELPGWFNSIMVPLVAILKPTRSCYMKLREHIGLMLMLIFAWYLLWI
jgi:hypothetical protein